MALSEANLAGLLRLLNEPDSEEAGRLISRLRNIGARDVNRLYETALRGREPDHVMSHVFRLQWLVAFDRRSKQWNELASVGVVDLEKALMLIARAVLPGHGYNARAVARRLDAMAEEVGARLAGDRAFDIGLEALQETLAGVYGLRGNHDNPWDPYNSVLPETLRRGFGSPEMLGAVALLVGRRLDLPVHAVGAGDEILGFYGDPAIPLGVYFDPFNSFTRLTRGDVEGIAGSLRGNYAPVVLDDRELVSRVLGRLITFYELAEDGEGAEAFRSWQQSLLQRGRTGG